MHGVGASVVNALSNWLEVQVRRDGHTYQQRYERGKTMYPLKIVGDCPLEETGSKVTFSPDGSIFEDTVYDYDVLRQRLREMAFLTKNLRIILTDNARSGAHGNLPLRGWYQRVRGVSEQE